MLLALLFPGLFCRFGRKGPRVWRETASNPARRDSIKSCKKRPVTESHEESGEFDLLEIVHTDGGGPTSRGCRREGVLQGVRLGKARAGIG